MSGGSPPGSTPTGIPTTPPAAGSGSRRNFDFRSWPRRFETTPLYVPERVWDDFEANYGLADQFRFMERQGTVKVVLVAEDEPFAIGDTTVTPVPLDAENAHAFLFERDRQARARRDGRDARMDARPTSARSTSPSCPVGVFEHHPYTGERLIPEEFCKPPVKKTRYGQALEMAARARAAPRRPRARRGDGPALARRARPPRARPTAGSRRATG